VLSDLTACKAADLEITYFMCLIEHK
jgi:hypothetical protein